MTRLTSRLNLRDLGGLITADGLTVAAGRLFRSGALIDLPPDDEAAVLGLGLRTVLDLRSSHERAAVPGAQLPGAEHLWLDVLGDTHEAGPARLGEVLRDPVGATLHLGDGRAEQVFRAAYRDMVSSPLARVGYGRMLRVLLSPEAGPVLFHCAAGKDRTGWAAALVLTALGVPSDTVLADYLATNDAFLLAHQGVIGTWEARGGDPEVLLAVMSARPSYLLAAVDEVEKVHGGIEGYLIDGLSLQPDVIAQLRARLLVPSN